MTSGQREKFWTLRPMKKKLIISLLTGLAFSAATLWLAFHNIQLSEIVTYLHKVNYLWVLPMLTIGLFSFLIRIVRWHLIINSTTSKASFKVVYHTLMTGFMLNCILPGRIGEIARPVILKKQSNVPFSTGLATIVAERIFDITALITLFAALLSTIEIDPNLVVTFGGYKISADILSDVFSGLIKLSILLITGIISINIKTIRSLIIRITLKIPSWLFFLNSNYKQAVYNKIAVPVSEMIENFSGGLTLLNNPVKVLICILLSYSVWITQAASYYLMSLGCPGIELSFLEIATVMVIICFTISLPSVPGFWGLWEAGGIFALAVFSVARDYAAGYTLINHVFQIVPVIIVGGISAFITGININQLYTKRL